MTTIYKLIPLKLPVPDSPGWIIDTKNNPIPIRRDKVRVGRAPSNDLKLPSGHVSRYHAILESTEEGLLVKDLDSQNGTSFAEDCTTKAIKNGVRIAGQKCFQYGQGYDVIVFGDIPFKVITVPGGAGDDDIKSQEISHAHPYELLLQGTKIRKNIPVGKERELTLNRGTIKELIGRDDPLIDENKHCSISIKNGQLTIQANFGDIKVNGRNTTKATLEVNDVISIGNLCFRIRSTG